MVASRPVATASIAQLVEQRIRNARVGGSSPLAGSILKAPSTRINANVDGAFLRFRGFVAFGIFPPIPCKIHPHKHPTQGTRPVSARPVCAPSAPRVRPFRAAPIHPHGEPHTSPPFLALLRHRATVLRRRICLEGRPTARVLEQATEIAEEGKCREKRITTPLRLPRLRDGRHGRGRASCPPSRGRAPHRRRAREHAGVDDRPGRDADRPIRARLAAEGGGGAALDLRDLHRIGRGLRRQRLEWRDYRRAESAPRRIVFEWLRVWVGVVRNTQKGICREVRKESVQADLFHRQAEGGSITPP